jgi:hypothetical protein
MAFTENDLIVLEKAIAQGATRVKYADKEVEYRSLADMMIIRDSIRNELGLNGTLPNPNRHFASFDKGIK